MRFRKRLALLYVVFCAGLGLVLLRTLYMQTVDAATWDAAARESLSRAEHLQAPRGRILDRNGIVLAHDEPQFQLAVVPQAFVNRYRGRCRVCGYVKWFSDNPDKRKRQSRICPCQREEARLGGASTVGSELAKTIEPLAPPNYERLEAMLQLKPGDLLSKAKKRVHDIEGFKASFVAALRASGETVFAETRGDAFFEDMMHRPYVIETGLDKTVAQHLMLDELGDTRGFRVLTDLRRRYPQGDHAPRLLGYATKVRDESELETLRKTIQRANGHTRVGRRGIERALDALLQGSPGRRLLGRNAEGGFTEVLHEEPPVAGQDVHLALDADASRFAERVLEDPTIAQPDGYYPKGRPSACFFAMDAETGEILIWAETPRFDLSTEIATLYDPLYTRRVADVGRREWLPLERLPDGMDLATWQEHVDAPAALGLSRIGQLPVEPGSTFKPLVGLALVHASLLDGYSTNFCTGPARRGPSCHGRGCGSVDLIQAIGTSCNQYFAHAVRYANPPEFRRRRKALGAILADLGIGQNPAPAYPEWAEGTWLTDGYDFDVAGVVREAQRVLEARAEDAKGPGGSHPVPEILFVPAAKCPTTVGGKPAGLRKLIADSVQYIARASGQARVRVEVGRAERGASNPRSVRLRFTLRAGAPVPWTSLPGASAQFPAAWERMVKRKRMGLAGNPARGGALWFEVAYVKQLGRDTPAGKPVLHPHDASNVAIGQGPVLATPLQMARAMAAISNGGWLVTPHAARSVGGRRTQHARTRLGLSDHALTLVRNGMREVVESGTARRHGKWDEVPAYVYGKTGTAQVGRSWRPWGDPESVHEVWHHWFVGFAETPRGRPVAFACVFHARTEAAAGLTAVPATSRILKHWFSK